MIELKIGSCYENGEIQEDGKNKIVGPMESYGSILFKDEKGFPFFKDGEFFDFSDVIYGFGKRPSRNLIKEVPCPENKKGKK